MINDGAKNCYCFAVKNLLKSKKEAMIKMKILFKML